MPQHGEAVLALDADRLDDVTVGHDVEEVAQLAVDAGDDDVAAAGTGLLEQLTRRRPLRDRSLAPGDGDGDLCRHGGCSSFSGWGWCGLPRRMPPGCGLPKGIDRTWRGATAFLGDGPPVRRARWEGRFA